MTTEGNASVVLICGTEPMLSDVLVTAALEISGTADRKHAHPKMRCDLERRHQGEHLGIVCEIGGPDTGAVWTRWTDTHPPYVVLVLRDCPATRDDQDAPCGLFADHPGAHSWALSDPECEAVDELFKLFRPQLAARLLLVEPDTPEPLPEHTRADP
ncbi:hypothetical protein ACQPZG_18370 [Streptomyces sp. CA-294286]|uniref:hypothetical protein n=1 Tax=Streptomyces sp. CA-294286 TaxID=3240070 RepID=UPI003D913FFA